MARDAQRLVILYDGVCGLCHRLVQFLIRHDPQDRFRFAALQGALAAEVLQRHGRAERDLDTVYLVEQLGTTAEVLHGRGGAVLRAVRDSGGALGVGARLLSLLPKPLLDWGYGQVARRRYRLFGKFEACALPTPAQRAKFLD